MHYTIYVDKSNTADYQTTYGLLQILGRTANEDDISAFLEERNLPLDEIGRRELAARILKNHPKIGTLTISNALQWRLQYGRVISLSGDGQTEGLETLFASK